MSLRAFIQQIYWGENLTADESRRNLVDGLVEILYRGGHSSNGLLITDDGYLLTARHCLDFDGPREFTIRGQDGTLYPVTMVSSPAPHDDIALAKADIPAACAPKRYRLNAGDAYEKMPVTLMTRWNRSVYYNCGVIQAGNDEVIYVEGQQIVFDESNHFRLMLAVQHGDSGGIIVDNDGRLVGFLSAKNEIYDAFGIKLVKALEVVEFHAVRRGA